MARKRHSLRELENLYSTGENESLLENVIRAFRGIQQLDSTHPDSYFNIAGFHGEPLRGKGAVDGDWWGGFCNHGNVLFPTWHRAYLVRFENALKRVGGCQDVTLPFWDECFDPKTPNPIPPILTTPKFTLDGEEIDNPLYSYKLQEALDENVIMDGKTVKRYSKHKGYETVRFPLASLVGTPKEVEGTYIHNTMYKDPKTNTDILNWNVVNWLQGKAEIPDDDVHTRRPDTYSILSGFHICLDAPNYTIFSNTTSQNNYVAKCSAEHPDDPNSKHVVVSIESPHNAIHLAVGGFYQKGIYNADTILGANADMGDNETASFDLIFFFHHAFVDYVFWAWQKRKELTAAGSLIVDTTDPGAKSQEGMPYTPARTVLDMATPLYPFQQLSGDWYTSHDVIDIVDQLGYEYGPGSLDLLKHDHGLNAPEAAPIVAIKRVSNINRAKIEGSFVIRTIAKGLHGKEMEIGREAILSRWSVRGCANCQNKLNAESLTPIDKVMLHALCDEGEEEKIEYKVQIQTHDKLIAAGGDTTVDDL